MIERRWNTGYRYRSLRSKTLHRRKVRGQEHGEGELVVYWHVGLIERVLSLQ